MAPSPEAVEKKDDAKVVLVIGDFLASGAAEGLSALFGQDANIRVVDKANGSSGIVRDDFYNWPNEIDAILEAEKPAAVVVMLGSNDRQQMRAGAQRLEPRSDEWLKEYERRATGLAEKIEDRGIEVVWIGMPSFRHSALSSEMLALNSIFKTVATNAEADYVDIWDGFVDESGGFITTGPDMNGQQARLRADDGINLTGAGKRKIAFYAERPLRRILGSSDGATPDLMGPAYQPNAGLGVPERQRIERTVPISLADPELDGGTALLGEKPASAGRNEADQQMREQRQDGTQLGRADDFGIAPQSSGSTITGSTRGSLTLPAAQ